MKTTQRISILLLSTFVILSASAQKELKALKQYVKAGQHSEVLKEFSRLKGDSTWKTDPQIYDLAFQSYQKVYTIQNEKMYLKAKADTAAYFAAVRGMFATAKDCEKMEVLRQQTKGSKPSYRSSHSSVLRDLFPNLLVASTYCYKSGEFREAEEAAYLLLRISDYTDFWGGAQKVPQLTSLQRQLASLIHVQGNYQMKEYRRMFEYADTALLYQPARAELLDELSIAHLSLGDTVRYLATLKQGMDEFPERDVFYDRQARYMIQHQQYDELISLSRQMLETMPERIDILNQLAYALYATGQTAELLPVAEHIIRITPDDARANYYLFSYYISQAKQVNVPPLRRDPQYQSRIAERKKWYEAARQPLERYRQACPDDSETWAPLLYEVYLNLNMGPEFEEISRIVN